MFQKILSVNDCDPFQKIKECEVISFDIFDTAIIRPFLHHQEMYKIVEKLIPNKKFASVRIRAEKNTRNDLIHKQRLKEEVTISDIYEHIHIDKEKAIAFELGFDVDICRKRQYIFKLYKFALNLNKRIIFTSDITYPRVIIEEILRKNGYGTYEKLYISSEENLSKHQGGLYKKLIFEMNVAPHRILHIGDSIKADIHQARKHGIKPLYIPRPLHALSSVINKKKFCIEKNILNSALFASSANIICEPTIPQKKTFLVTFPFIYKLAMEILKEKKENPVFLINEGHGNGLFHLFSEVYSHFSQTSVKFCEIDISQVYASSVRTFDDLTILKQNVSKENFSHILSVCFHVSNEIIARNNIEDLAEIWPEIEINALKIRKEIIEKCDFLKTQSVYDFTFSKGTKDFLQSLLGTSIKNYTQIHNVLEQVIVKSTTSAWLSGWFFDWFSKPNPLEIIEDMKSITNEEMQRYIFPQSQYFFSILGRHLNILDKKTLEKIK